MTQDLTNLPLECPRCHELLDGIGTPLRTCLLCENHWVMDNGKWWFGGESTMASGDELDNFKSRIKMFPNLYGTLVDLVSPVYPHLVFEKRKLRNSLPPESLAIDVGSGNTRIVESVINIDLMPYPNVDIVAEAGRIPFINDSVDLVFSIAVLEHVRDPEAAISEIVRVLRPGGSAYIFVPFIQGFHSSPHDYQRYTRAGLEYALRKLQIVRTENFGPTSGLVWILGEWLSIPLSFGIASLQWRLATFFQVALSPLKFLDFFLRKMPGAENIATGFLVVAKK